MKTKVIGILVAAGAAAALFFGSMFAADTVFAAAETAGDGETLGTQICALTSAEVKRAYKKELYGDLGCTLTLPDGYVPSGEIKGMYISERNPLDSSNIYYAVAEDVDTEALNEMLGSDEYKERMEQKLKETYGQQAVIENFRYTGTDIDGCPAHKVELSCRSGDAEMEQLVYIIMADKVYTITYSQSADDERMDEFKKSAESIHIVYEY